MKWEMEIEEVEAVLEKIWDLHDKLSDAIHSISRAHFLTSVKALRSSSDDFFLSRSAALNNNNNRKKTFPDSSDDNLHNGFVYVKEFPIEEDDESVIQEAKSLNAIRTALENLEDQLEFFHTVQTQQRVERDAAIARLEQSRIVLALRLAEHQGKKYKVIEEARAFVGEVRDHGQFTSTENRFGSVERATGKNYVPHEGKRSNILVKAFISSFTFAKKWLKMDQMGGICGNAALVALSMIALLHLQQQAAQKDRYMLDLPERREDSIPRNRNVTKVFQPESSSSRGRSADLDVLLARG